MGAAVLKYAPQPRLAQKFLAFMVSHAAQALLPNSTVDFEYPLRPGVPANQALKPFGQPQPPAITVTQLGDNREALQLLQQAGVPRGPDQSTRNRWSPVHGMTLDGLPGTKAKAPDDDVIRGRQSTI